MDMAELLNLGCLCRTLQPGRLETALASRTGAVIAPAALAARPHLFSATPVFLSQPHARLIRETVAALHRVTALPGYREAALREAGPLAAIDHGPLGAFMGYDFHVTAAGPRLIEINTNAGGGLLHAAGVRAHRACCTPMDSTPGAAGRSDPLDDAFRAMFLREWLAQRGPGAPLQTVAIVDDDPQSQYLAPEFELARALFEGAGIRAVVTDPRELRWSDGRLWHPGFGPERPVDLVYNRLTDFDLHEEAHAALRAAYAAGGAVITPHPRAHALQADKRNLVALGDEARLRAWGATDADAALLGRVVPATQPVTADNADALWSARRQFFFKPWGGFGSRGAYRGDKLTRRVWDEIRAGGYIAQALVAPGERAVRVDGQETRLKVDVRAYAYAGEVLLLAARSYAGQTTNFRTPGGGFSPVVEVPERVSGSGCAC